MNMSEIKNEIRNTSHKYNMFNYDEIRPTTKLEERLKYNSEKWNLYKQNNQAINDIEYVKR